ncbi:hypothetical protein ACSL9F_002673 [Vibrio cholerae]|nr:hypothetical protein [Vibrio cholerae]
MSGEYNFDFGMACEGDTDFPVIERIIEGVFCNFELEDEITELQPLNLQGDDETRGGDSRLLHYLTLKRFRDDVFACRYIVIQVDTDVPNSGRWANLNLRDANGKELPVEDIVKKVRDYLIEKIESGQPGFYESNAGKIIFAISVHSIECWLFSLKSTNAKNVGKIKNCESLLADVLRKDKNLVDLTEQVKGQKGQYKMKKEQNVGGKSNYALLANGFVLKNGKNIQVVRKQDSSFDIFVTSLEGLNYEPEED